MDPAQPTRDDAIARIVDVLRAHGARDIYLFGSWGTPRAWEGSDIDIAVSGIPPERFFAAAGAAVTASGRMVDLLDIDCSTPFTRFLRAAGRLRRVG